MSAENAERLEQVAALVRLLDTGDPDRTRSALLRPRTDEDSTFDLLCAGRYREALTVARRSAVELVRPPARLKEAAGSLRSRSPWPVASLTARVGEKCT